MAAHAGTVAIHTRLGRAGPGHEPLSAIDVGRPGPAKRGRELPTVPGYEILGELGRGGMGVVYKARQLQLNRARRPEDDPGRRPRRRRTSWPASAPRPRPSPGLQHPNIVQIYEVGEHDGLPFFSLEFVRRRQPGRAARRHAAAAAPGGRSWSRRWPGPCTRPPARHRPPRPEAGQRPAPPLATLEQPAETSPPLEPSATGDAVPKITDFGLAKQLRRATRPDARPAPSWARPATWPPSRPPGKAKDDRPGRRRLRPGRDPLRAADRPAAVQGARRRWTPCCRCCTDEPVPPRRLQPQVPRDLETICLKCLQKEPAARYARPGTWPTTCAASWPASRSGPGRSARRAGLALVPAQPRLGGDARGRGGAARGHRGGVARRPWRWRRRTR